MSLHPPKSEQIETSGTIKLKSLKIKSLSKSSSKAREEMNKVPPILNQEHENGVGTGRESQLHLEYEDSVNETYGTLGSMPRARSQSKTGHNGIEPEILQNYNSHGMNSRDESQMFLKHDQSYDNNNLSEDFSPQLKVLARNNSNPFTLNQLKELERNLQLESNEPSRIIEAKPTEIVNLKMRAIHNKSPGLDSTVTPSFTNLESHRKEHLDRTNDKIEKYFNDKGDADKSINDRSLNEQVSLRREISKEYDK